MPTPKLNFMNNQTQQFLKKYEQIKLLDEETISMLNEFASGNPEIVQDILDSFEPEAIKLMEEIKIASENKDVQLLKTAAHSLSGISGSIGAARLRQVATDTENAIKAENLNEAFELSEILSLTFDELIVLLKNM
ncbi:MAG: Hpt domain-containing protein [Bacteroidetes bacterium]|nr:MAG: Hpt domain-containing protein [Bacteroidota bacterium]